MSLEARLLREAAYNLSGTDPQETQALLQMAAAKIDELHTLLAERGAKLAALEKQEPVAHVVVEPDYWSGGHFYEGSKPYIRYAELRELRIGDKLYTAAGAAPVPEDWRSAVAMAYGHLWHINNEPMAPIPLRSEESASYAARKLLRDLMTTKERGEAINAVQKLLAAAPKDAP